MTRRRQVTEQAATAAIEQGCRMLRLPTIRDRFAEIAAAAEREQLSYLGFLSELVIAECDDRTRRRAGVSFHLCKSGVVHHRTAVGRTEGVFCDQDHADAG